MADLGAIGIRAELAKISDIMSYPTAVVGMPHNQPYPTHAFSGTVKDASGNNASRRLIFVERISGMYVGQTTSAANGTFSFSVPFAVEHDIICQDDAAGTTYNDLIIRSTPA